MQQPIKRSWNHSRLAKLFQPPSLRFQWWERFVTSQQFDGNIHLTVNTGGRIRSCSMLRILKRKHHITYLALEEAGTASDARHNATEYCHEVICVPHPALAAKYTGAFYRELFLNLFSPLPHFIAKFRSAPMQSTLRHLLESKHFDILVCDFLSACIHLEGIELQLPSLLFQHNVEAVIWKRFSEVEKRLPHHHYLKNQWRKAEAYEQVAINRFDFVTSVSPIDEAIMQQSYNARPSRIASVPLGVDTSYFRPRSSASAQKPHHLVFTGSLDWLPNNDGICWFIKKIFPILQYDIPSVTLTVVGREPSPKLMDLAAETKGKITVTGRVEDVRPYVEQASAFIVPLRIGGGTRLKIYEGLAMEKAIISTTIGAEGLPLEDGVHILLADQPADFAKSVQRVLNDSDFASSLGQQGAALVRDRFSWTTAADVFAEHCKEAIANYRVEECNRDFGAVKD